MARRAPSPLTGGVQLRDVTEDDLAIFFHHQLDPDANNMAAFTPRDRAAFAAHWTRILGDESITKKTILLDGHVAGNILSYERSGEREVGCWMGKQYWGRGVATEALSQFLDHVVVHPLYARVAKRNIASIRVLEKCGFTISGEDKGFSTAPGGEVEEFILKLEADERDRAP